MNAVALALADLLSQWGWSAGYPPGWPISLRDRVRRFIVPVPPMPRGTG